MTKNMLSACSVALILGCSSELLNISLQEEAQAVVPASDPLTGELVDLVGDVGFSGFTDMQISQSEVLQNQGVSPGDITTVFLTEFTIEVVEPQDQDLSFLSSVAVYVEADGLDKQLVALSDEFPEGESQVSFAIENVDLAPYVVADSMSLTTDVEGSLPSEEVTLNALFALDVGVTQQGACRAISQATDSGS